VASTATTGNGPWATGCRHELWQHDVVPNRFLSMFFSAMFGYVRPVFGQISKNKSEKEVRYTLLLGPRVVEE